MKEELPKGFACECGKEHRFPLYVYAHWSNVLNFTCPDCGATYAIVRGYASRVVLDVKKESI